MKAFIIINIIPRAKAIFQAAYEVIYPGLKTKIVLKELKCNVKHTEKLCKIGASQIMGILTAVNSGICLALSYFWILVTIMISSALKNARILRSPHEWQPWHLLIQTTKEEVSVSESTVYANSQETPAMCVSTICFYSD